MAADAANTPDRQPKAKIFISYSRNDLDFADRPEAALRARGFEPLIDRAEIYAFEDWWKRIEALIGRRRTVTVRSGSGPGSATGPSAPYSTMRTKPGRSHFQTMAA